MARAVEAIYENGKLSFAEKVDDIKKSRAIVVFLDEERRQKGRQRDKLMEEALPEVGLSEETIKEYKRKLNLAEERMKKKGIDLLKDPFLSLEPGDLGYTDPNLLDSIIANEAMKGRGNKV